MGKEGSSQIAPGIVQMGLTKNTEKKSVQMSI